MTQETLSLSTSIEEILESAGLHIETPYVRSSDYGLVLNDPFRYFLSRRIGLTRAAGWSEALSRGSWFAERMLYAHHPDPSKPLAKKLAQRFDEIRAIASKFSWGPDRLKGYLETEQKNYACAMGWWEAAMTLEMANGFTYQTYFARDGWEWLGSELVATATIGGIPCRAQFDHLYFDSKRQKLWVVDDKTTSYDPNTRVQVCPNEFQSQLYCGIAEELLIDGTLSEKFGIPETATLGGMYHVAFKKPTIDFGSKDRPYRLISNGKRSGKRGVWDPDTNKYKIIEMKTGEILEEGTIALRRQAESFLREKCEKIAEPVYEGEPDLDLYIKRCERWLKKQGEFKDAEGVPTPTRIAYSILNEEWFESIRPTLHQRLKVVEAYRTAQPALENFPKGVDLIDLSGNLSPYAPLYVLDPDRWAGALQTQELIVKHRDETDMDAMDFAESEIRGL